MDWLERDEHIYSAVEAIEDELKSLEECQGSLRYATVLLAWHKLMDAIELLSSGRLTPNDLLWGAKKANELGRLSHKQDSGLTADG